MAKPRHGPRRAGASSASGAELQGAVQGTRPSRPRCAPKLHQGPPAARRRRHPGPWTGNHNRERPTLVNSTPTWPACSRRWARPPERQVRGCSSRSTRSSTSSAQIRRRSSSDCIACLSSAFPCSSRARGCRRFRGSRGQNARTPSASSASSESVRSIPRRGCETRARRACRA